MVRMSKVLIIIFIFLVCTHTSGNYTIERDKSLSIGNRQLVPELRAKIDDGDMLIMHINPNFYLVEYIDSKECRKTIVQDGVIEISGFGRVDTYKLAKNEYFTKEKK